MQFKAKFFLEYHRIFGKKERFATSYHPKSIGQIESLNSTTGVDTTLYRRPSSGLIPIIRWPEVRIQFPSTHINMVAAILVGFESFTGHTCQWNTTRNLLRIPNRRWSNGLSACGSTFRWPKILWGKHRPARIAITTNVTNCSQLTTDSFWKNRS